MIFVMSDSTLETDASSTDSFSDSVAAGAAAETVVVFGLVPVSLVAVLTEVAVDEVVAVVDGTDTEEVVASVVLSVECDLAAETFVPSPAAAAPSVEGPARFNLVTTFEYCCISITAASNNT